MPSADYHPITRTLTRRRYEFPAGSPARAHGLIAISFDPQGYVPFRFRHQPVTSVEIDVLKMGDRFAGVFAQLKAAYDAVPYPADKKIWDETIQNPGNSKKGASFEEMMMGGMVSKVGMLMPCPDRVPGLLHHVLMDDGKGNRVPLISDVDVVQAINMLKPTRAEAEECRREAAARGQLR